MLDRCGLLESAVNVSLCASYEKHDQMLMTALAAHEEPGQHCLPGLISASLEGLCRQ